MSPTQARLVDTHCHLDATYLPEGSDEVLRRAREAHVSGFVVIGVGATLEPAREAVALAKKHPHDVSATVGIHPHDAQRADREMLDESARLGLAPEVVAIGETGLDYHYEHSPKAVQKAVFAELIATARALRKPIVVHTRSAPHDTLDVLRSEQASDVGGVIHCFSEDIAFARQALDLGFYLSFSGIVTFKSARSVHETAAWAPLDRILIETDSPYLAPVPHRGKPCEPAFVVHTATRVAELRHAALADIAEATTRNAERLFGRTFG